MPTQKTKDPFLSVLGPMYARRGFRQQADWDRKGQDFYI
jgi:hypothetical protein